MLAIMHVLTEHAGNNEYLNAKSYKGKQSFYISDVTWKARNR
jgi:hypothetical protein